MSAGCRRQRYCWEHEASGCGEHQGRHTCREGGAGRRSAHPAVAALCAVRFKVAETVDSSSGWKVKTITEGEKTEDGAGWRTRKK